MLEFLLTLENETYNMGFNDGWKACKESLDG